MSWHPPKSLCECFSVTVLTTRAHFRAPTHWIPCRFSPFDLGMLAHFDSRNPGLPCLSVPRHYGDLKITRKPLHSNSSFLNSAQSTANPVGKLRKTRAPGLRS